MIKQSLLVVLGWVWISAVFSAVPAFAGPADDPISRKSGEYSVQVDEAIRWFAVRRPKSVKPGSALVILLHGGVGNMHQTLSRPFGKDWNRLSIQHGFVLIAPNGTNSETGDPRGKRQHWNDFREPAAGSGSAADDVGFIVELIEWAARVHEIDKSRVYVTGASNGGMMTFRLLQEAPEAFAGGAAFIANLPAKTPLPGEEFSTPIFIANGTDDPLMKWEGGMIGSRGQQDKVLSVEATRHWWLTHNGAEPTPTRSEQLPDNDQKDKCRLSLEHYAAGDDGAKVVFMTMQGGGHAQPSFSHRKRQSRFSKKLFGTLCRDANGAALVWAFFTSS